MEDRTPEGDRRESRALGGPASSQGPRPAVNRHAPRHHCTTDLLAKGMDLRTVPELMRYKTAAITMRYAHSTSERRRAAVEKVLA